MDRLSRVVEGLVRWLTGHPRPLFGPPILAEVTIIVGPDGRGRLFAPRFLDDSPEALKTVAAAIIRTGMWFAESRGLTVQVDKEPA